MSSPLDVIIVGAGAAGLTAAYDLYWDDWNVQVLEASNTVGGRIQKNDQFADFPIDLGAEWIHVPPSILDDIVADDNCPVNLDIYNDEQLFGTWEEGEFYTEIDFTTDFKFRDYTWFDFFNDYIAWDLLQNNKVIFGCQVTEVRYNSNPSQVKCSNGQTFSAKHVIVTASIGVLARGDISFFPSLPGNVASGIQEAGNPTNFPNGIKTWIKFSQKFWGNTMGAFDLEGHYTPTGDRMFYDASSRQRSNEFILGVYLQGDKTEEFEGKSDQDIVDVYLRDLAIMFGNDVYDYYDRAGKQYLVKNWKNDPYVRGSFSMYHTTGWRTIWQLRRTIGPQARLQFAGEAIPRDGDDYEWAFAHGAALSGRGAARAIMNTGTGSGNGNDEPGDGNGSGNPITRETNEFSEEGIAQGNCPSVNGVQTTMVGLNCDGRYCDNLRLTCYNSGSVEVNPAITTSDWFSEEDGGLGLCPDDGNRVITRVQCSGSYCDDLRLHCQELSNVVLDYDNCGETSMIPAIQDEDDYGQIPDGSYAIGIKNSGDYAAFKVIRYCFPDGSSAITRETNEFSEEGIAQGNCPSVNGVQTTMVGLNCDGRYCDNLRLTCYNSGSVEVNPAITTSDWFSEEDGGLGLCPDDGNRVITRVQCSGSYCDDLRLHCQELSNVVLDYDNCGETSLIPAVQDQDGYGQIPDGSYAIGIKNSGDYAAFKVIRYCYPQSSRRSLAIGDGQVDKEGEGKDEGTPVFRKRALRGR